MLKDLILKNRTYRRFYQSEVLERETLEKLVDLARLSSTGGNLQPLKYYLSHSVETNQIVFDTLKWAAYFKDWDGPIEGERPSGYIIMLGDKEISSNYLWNHGIAAQSILLGATEIGLGGCMFGSVNKAELAKQLALSEQYEILMVIALGKPKEVVVLEDMKDTKDVKYWREPDDTHHVPKRLLEDIII